MSVDTELRRRSAFRVLLPPLLFGVVVLASTFIRVYHEQPAVAVLVLRGGIGLIALWAVYDGLLRALGRPTYLGTGKGVDRLFGLAQILASVGVAIALIPNTLRFLNFFARLVAGALASGRP